MRKKDHTSYSAGVNQQIALHLSPTLLSLCLEQEEKGIATTSCLHQISPLLPTAVPQPARWEGHREGIAQSFSATLLSSLPFSSLTLMWLYTYEKHIQNNHLPFLFPYALSFTPCPSSGSSAPPSIMVCFLTLPVTRPALLHTLPPSTACGAQVFPLFQPSCRLSDHLPSIAADKHPDSHPHCPTCVKMWQIEEGSLLTSRALPDLFFPSACGVGNTTAKVMSASQGGNPILHLQAHCILQTASWVGGRSKTRVCSKHQPIREVHTLCQNSHQPLHFRTTTPVRAHSFYSQEA